MLFVTAEDSKLHFWERGPFLLCRRVVVRAARPKELATRDMCELCVANRSAPATAGSLR